jgi:hypothetical protein
MWSEATSAIHELAFRGEIDTETGLSAIGRLRQLGVVRSDHPDLHLEAAHLARRLGGFKTPSMLRWRSSPDPACSRETRASSAERGA